MLGVEKSQVLNDGRERAAGSRVVHLTDQPGGAPVFASQIHSSGGAGRQARNGLCGPWLLDTVYGPARG